MAAVASISIVGVSVAGAAPDPTVTAKSAGVLRSGNAFGSLGGMSLEPPDPGLPSLSLPADVQTICGPTGDAVVLVNGCVTLAEQKADEAAADAEGLAGDAEGCADYADGCVPDHTFPNADDVPFASGVCSTATGAAAGASASLGPSTQGTGLVQHASTCTDAEADSASAGDAKYCGENDGRKTVAHMWCYANQVRTWITNSVKYPYASSSSWRICAAFNDPSSNATVVKSCVPNDEVTEVTYCNNLPPSDGNRNLKAGVGNEDDRDRTIDGWATRTTGQCQ